MKKRIIIVLLVILLCSLGAIIYLYNFTDIFKSDEQLFWKYAVQHENINELFCNESIKKINNERLNSSYIKKSELQYKQDGDTFELSTNTNALNSDNVFTDLNLKKNSNEIAKMKFFKKSNIVGIKMDELADGYIAVKSNRLKEISNMIGLKDSDNLPDSLNVFTGYDVLELSSEDNEYILSKYGNLIKGKTTSKNYKKLDDSKIKIEDKFYNVNGYELILSENETKNILVGIFDDLSKDSQTLNILSSKLKMMNIPEKYSSVNSLSDRFSNVAKRIDTMETSDEEYIKVIIYVNNNKVIQMNFEYSDGNKVIVNYSKENNNLKIYQKTNDSELSKASNENKKSFKFLKEISNNAYNIISKINQVDLNMNVSDELSEIISNLDISFEDGRVISYKSSIKITDEININDDYDNSKKIVLNNLNQKQLEQIYTLLTKNITELYKEKMGSAKLQ